MDQTVFTTILQWILAHGYLFLLGLMMIEGPMVTTAAAFASSWGYFEPGWVYVLSIFGDVVPDIIYYYLGWGFEFVLPRKLKKRLSLPLTWQTKIENFLKENTSKTVTFIKMTPFLPLAGLAFLGARRAHLGKVIWTCTWISAIKDLIFVFVGYTLGRVFSLDTYLKYGNWVLPALLIIFVALYFVYRLAFVLLSKKVVKV